MQAVKLILLLEQLVQERTSKMEQQVAREQLLTQITNQIRASLNQEQVLETAVTALRDLLQCDRLLVYQFQSDGSGIVVAESVVENWQALRAATITDPCFSQQAAKLYREGKTIAIDNIHTCGYASCYLNLLEQYQVKAYLLVPILVSNKLWGLLVGHQCSDYRHWQPTELSLLTEISGQLAIAIQQAAAYQQLQLQNAILERIAKAEPLAEILQDLLQAIETQLIDAVCSIMLHDGNGKLYCGTHTKLPAAYLQEINGISINEGIGSCGTVAFRQETVIVTDVATDPLWQNHPEWLVPQNLKACWSVPIFSSTGVILGVFGVYYRENRNPDIAEQETVTQAANIASIAIERHLATQTLQQLNQDLERRVAERTAALQISEERLQFLLSASPAVIFTANFDNNYQITFISENIRTLTGYTADDFFSDSSFWVSCIHPEDAPQVLKGISQLFEQGQHIHEYRFLHSAGNYIWLRNELRLICDRQQNPIEIIGYCINISDSKQTELALQESQRFIQQIADASPNILYLCDLPTQRNLYANREITSILGYTPEAVQAMGSNVFPTLLHPEDLSRLPQQWQRLKMAADEEIVELEYRMRHANGEWRWLYSRDTVFRRDAEGQVQQIIGTAQDITARKLAEQQHQLLKERLQFVLSANPAVIFTCKPEADYDSTFISDNISNVTGYSPAEFIDNPRFWIERIHPEDVSRILNGLSHLFEQGQHIHEYRFLHKAGHYIWLRNELRLIRDRQQNPIEIVGYAADISDAYRQAAQRQQAELALQESQRFIQQIADASPNMLYLYDLPTQSNLYGNRAITSILGYSVEAVQAMGSNLLTDLFHPDDLPRLIAQREQIKMAVDGEIIEFEYRMKHANGQWRWLHSWDTIFSRDADGKVQQIIGTAQDISDRKRLEAAQNRLIALLEASTDYILIVDVAGNTIWNNEALKRLRGIDNAAVKQQKPIDYYPQNGVDLITQQAIPAAIANGSWLGENILLNAQGQEIPVSQLLLSHKSPQGEVEFFSTIMRDIRIQKEYEQSLEQTNAELRRATRLKDEFLANMSHELRTPLNAILGMSESLLDTIWGNLNPQQQDAIATIERSGQHLLSLINDILELSKIEADKLELQITQVSVAQLCKTSLDFVKQQAFRKQIHLDLSLPTFAKEIAVDERRIQQVLINLLSNAIKFTPSGGRVSLHVKVQNFGEVADNSTWILFSVTDTGIGIAPADQARLFQPFVQIDSSLNRKYEGTGLGLVLVKRITEMHGGYVILRSELNQGSCFTVCLPDTSNQLPPSSTFNLPSFIELATNSIAIAPPEIITAPTTGDSPLILLAEDNEANINTISSYLEAKGYRVLMAKNGQEAIDLTYTHHPDLIIMDIQMPLVDGLVAIKQIRQNQQLATIPIVALTAMAMLGDREKCIAAGANEYVAKPIKLKQLTAIIQQLLTIS